MAISPSEEAVRLGHVDERAAFYAVFISDVEANVVRDVEFLQASMVLKRGT